MVLSIRTVADYLDIWTLVVKILDGTNRELHQSVARDLADDELGGPEFVEKTVGELRLTVAGIYQDDIKLAPAFLRAIAHPSLLPSQSIGTVGVI